MSKGKSTRKVPSGGNTGRADQDQTIPPQMAIRLEFGRRLRQAMADKGVKQIDVANGTKPPIGRDSMSGYARGRVLPTGERLKSICDYLGTAPEKLMPHYGIDQQSADLMPAFEVKQADTKGMAWVRINQSITLDKVVKIMAILQQDPS